MRDGKPVPYKNGLTDWSGRFVSNYFARINSAPKEDTAVMHKDRKSIIYFCSSKSIW